MKIGWPRDLPSGAWILLCGLAGVGAPLTAAAEIPDIVWEPAQIVDQPVTEMSSTSSPSMVFADGRWHIVYIRPGGVALYRTRDSLGWSPAVPIADDTAAAHDPKIAALPPSLLVAWDDARTGHQEVWTRLNDGTEWLAQECITCDAEPSRAPVVTSSEDSFDAWDYFVAWEEESLSVRRVRGRFFSEGAWGPVQVVSESPAEAFEPAVAVIPYFGIAVAWTDSRAGVPQIYLRPWYQNQGWQPEQVVSAESHPCRRPSIASELCCGSAISPDWMVAYEVELPGATESRWARGQYGGDWVSPPDGLPSVRPDMAGFTFYASWLFGVTPHYLAAWTDVPLAGPRRHVLIDFVSSGTEVLSESGLAHALVAAAEGAPRASLLALWVEERAGIPSLIARAGSVPGKVGVPDAAPASMRLTAVPNPCRDRVTFRVPWSSSPGMNVRIFDPMGRLVRTIPAGGTFAGETTWDLRNDSGLPVETGHYFAVVDHAGQRLWRTLIVLR